MPSKEPHTPREKLYAAREALRALSGLETYAPRDQAYAPAALAACEMNLALAEQQERWAREQYRVARAATLKAERELLTGVQGAKREVFAQYGDDSYAVEIFGLKRRSDYRHPPRYKKSVE